MKRSQVNQLIQEAIDFFDAKQFQLPPFAFYTVDDWAKLPADALIKPLKLGWDVTDFGSGDFDRCGLLLFTLRNGNAAYAKTYAEKIMIVRPGQVTPRHFHWRKTEDIINRGGGNLVLELFDADPAANRLTGNDFTVETDGVLRRLASGAKVVLTPGQSITLEPRHAHTFYGEPGTGTVMVGEISKVNDDDNDNCFVDGAPRFGKIIEDQAIHYLLAEDYAGVKL